MQRSALATTTAQSDLVLYHEMFNPCFTAIHTSELTRALAAFGLDFAWFHTPPVDELSDTSLERSIAADIGDFVRGQYRYSVFARYLNSSGPCNVTTDQVCWESTLIRVHPGEFTGEQGFTQPGGTGHGTMRAPASMAMLDCLAGQPFGWAELVRQVSDTIHGQGAALSAAELALMEGDLRLLWRHGLVNPVYRVAPEPMGRAAPG